MNVRTRTLLVLTILLTACTQAVSPAPPVLSTPAQVQTTTEPAANAPTLTPSITRTSAPTLTPPTTSTPTSPYPQLILSTELPPLGDSGMADLHNLIIFQSGAWMPFPPLRPPAQGHEEGGAFLNALSQSQVCEGSMMYGYNCLWAISPDGQSGALLSANDFDLDFILPPNSPPMIVENGFTINHPAVRPVRLPELCSQDPTSSHEQRCDEVRLSPDGRFLAFRHGLDRCGRAMQVIDRQTGEVILKFDERVHGFEYLTNGELMLGSGSCESGGFDFFDPLTRQTVSGGGYGKQVWNAAKTILVVAKTDYPGIVLSLWGYNTNQGTTFTLGKQDSISSDEQVVFLPDDRRFLFRHLGFQQNVETGGSTFNTPAQIVRFDPISGERTVLASDPAYHYILCQETNTVNPCQPHWYGDWIQVLRVPFTPVSTTYWDVSELFPCFYTVGNCPTPPEPLALNAETGELRPWDPAALPQVSPTPGPDLQSQPIYTDPAGLYALYTGTDGASLWMVPKEGPPVQWAIGENFFYLP